MGGISYWKGGSIDLLHPAITIFFKIITAWWLIQAGYGPLKAWLSRKLLIRQRNRLEKLSREFPQQSVALIIPAKGVSSSFEHFLDLILNQDYPNYRIIFVTQSAEDPAQLAIREYLQIAPEATHWTRPEGRTTGANEVEFVVAGLAGDEGQKVHNQLAAFKHLRDEQIVAFADADIVGGDGWLKMLITPINVGEAELTSGYRWFIPKSNHFSNLVATNINSGIGVLAGPRWHTLLWGGSMALSRKVFDEIQVPEALRGSLNDDLQISRVARESGKELYFVRSLMAPSPVDYSWGSLFEFGRRQYFQVLTYVPRYWGIALFFTGSWLLGAGTTWWRLLVLRDPQALVPIAIVAVMILLKFALRTSYLKEQFDQETIRKLRTARALELVTTTFNMAVHFVIVLSAALIRGITWAGIKYRVYGRQETVILSRD